MSTAILRADAAEIAHAFARPAAIMSARAGLFGRTSLPRGVSFGIRSGTVLSAAVLAGALAVTLVTTWAVRWLYDWYG